jgi:hypothetical protein
VFVGAGVVLGALTGLFGVGGSSMATPVLSLLGVPGLMAVASPLAATLPSAAVAAVPYVRTRKARPRPAAWTVLGAVPATVAGALLSGSVGGGVLLVVSGLVLVIVGVQVLRPVSAQSVAAGVTRRRDRPKLVLASAAVGLLTGILANGGGFLLVPVYLVLFGLSMTEAAGTSLLVIVVLTIPTLATHWALGHIDWSVAAALALGSLPSSALASRFAQRLDSTTLRRTFGWFLICCGMVFTLYRAVQ